MLKRGININLPVEFVGLTMSNVGQIDFLFKAFNSQYADVLKESVYKADGTGDAVLRAGTSIIDVPWSSEDTYKFPENSLVYMDTRIILNNSLNNPMTSILSFPMNPTLFENSVENDGNG